MIINSGRSSRTSFQRVAKIISLLNETSITTEITGGSTRFWSDTEAQTSYDYNGTAVVLMYIYDYKGAFTLEFTLTIPYLKTEDNFYVLKEDGFKIILEG